MTRYARSDTIGAHVPWTVTKGEPDEALKEPAPRRTERFVCAKGHRFGVTFDAAAGVPVDWDCRCGSQARLEGTEGNGRGRLRFPTYTTAGRGPERAHEGVSPREQLAKRRTDAELEVLLAEALDGLRRQRGEAG